MESRKLELLGNLALMDKHVKELKSYVCSLFSIYPLTDKENKQQKELDAKYKSTKTICERVDVELNKFNQKLDAVYELRTKSFEEKNRLYHQHNRLYTPVSITVDSNQNKQTRNTNTLGVLPRRVPSITPTRKIISVEENKQKENVLRRANVFNKRQSLFERNPTKNNDIKQISVNQTKKIDNPMLPTTKTFHHRVNNRDNIPEQSFQPHRIINRNPRTSLCNSSLLRPRNDKIIKSDGFKIPTTILNLPSSSGNFNNSNLNESCTIPHTPCCTPSRIPIAKTHIENKLMRKSILNLTTSNLLKTPTRCVNSIIVDTESTNTADICLTSRFGLPKNDYNEIVYNPNNRTVKRNSLLPSPSDLSISSKPIPYGASKQNKTFTPRVPLQKPKSPILESFGDRDKIC